MTRVLPSLLRKRSAKWIMRCMLSCGLSLIWTYTQRKERNVHSTSHLLQAFFWQLHVCAILFRYCSADILVSFCSYWNSYFQILSFFTFFSSFSFECPTFYIYEYNESHTTEYQSIASIILQSSLYWFLPFPHVLSVSIYFASLCRISTCVLYPPSRRWSSESGSDQDVLSGSG